jgi:hypothetical protein
MRVGTAVLALVLACVPLFAPPVHAQTPVPTAPTPTVTPGAIQIVEVTRAVPAGGAGTAGFTPPAGTTLVVTDMLVTNPNPTAVCGIDLARSAGAVTGGLTCAAS